MSLAAAGVSACGLTGAVPGAGHALPTVVHSSSGWPKSKSESYTFKVVYYAVLCVSTVALLSDGLAAAVIDAFVRWLQ
jgi:hypothetical protein